MAWRSGLGAAPVLFGTVCAAVVSTIVYVHYNQKSEKEVSTFDYPYLLRSSDVVYIVHERRTSVPHLLLYLYIQSIFYLFLVLCYNS